MFGLSTKQYKPSVSEFLKAMNVPQWETKTITKFRSLMVDVLVKSEKRTSVVKPKYQTAGAAAFDIAPTETLVIEPGELVRAGTGLVIKTPPEHFLMLTHRSSTPARHGVQVLLGIVDEDYAGDDDELAITVWNFTQKQVTIPAGTRIAQGLFIPVTHARFIATDKMPDPSRGGYGSTG